MANWNITNVDSLGAHFSVTLPYGDESLQAKTVIEQADRYSGNWGNVHILRRNSDNMVVAFARLYQPESVSYGKTIYSLTKPHEEDRGTPSLTYFFLEKMMRATAQDAKEPHFDDVETTTPDDGRVRLYKALGINEVEPSQIPEGLRNDMVITQEQLEQLPEYQGVKQVFLAGSLETLKPISYILPKDEIKRVERILERPYAALVR